ncbi:Zn2/Cys6 DNA-binding protein [Glarea lozoyensis ATCC 20868]|uniref:Zn2/Cys6 DNA-binding protein n=1 Tax=Glarea lozoyensis (strain ATCC 20868 / MF5171) TaxID=1116229 RepID=S3CWH0_GLAL2|nr:Zn2/Cys6 DNA-binding protein [Glarea lozoyensis ATCC 20868]EPE29995.1 Zn2/Cys6 DNA-binding protein [Glarea lozoyensis ATCC 20868]
MSSKRTEPLMPRKKLKESCTQCASAKVRCSKDKPQCTRCEDRNSVCSYGMSQRSGRRAGPSYHCSPTHLNKAGASGQPRPDIDGNVNMFTSPSDFYLDRGLWSACESLGWDMMDIKSPSSLSPGSQLLSDESLTSLDQWMDMGSDHCSALSVNDHNIHDISMPQHTSMQQTTSPSTSTSTPMSTPLNIISSPNKGSASCYETATHVIGAINSAPKSCSLATITSEISRPQQTIEQVIDANRTSIESVTIILNCPCATDQNLLSLITSIVFKVIQLYHSAAHTSPEPHPQKSLIVDTFIRQTAHHVPPVSAGTPIENTQLDTCSDVPRMRAQLILGEIHRVVRLVELLSQRFQEARMTSNRVGNDEDEAGEGNWISASVFVQLEADLRQRLRVVVKDTMAVLR